MLLPFEAAAAQFLTPPSEYFASLTCRLPPSKPSPCRRTLPPLDVLQSTREMASLVGEASVFPLFAASPPVLLMHHNRPSCYQPWPRAACHHHTWVYLCWIRHAWACHDCDTNRPGNYRSTAMRRARRHSLGRK